MTTRRGRRIRANAMMQAGSRARMCDDLWTALFSAFACTQILFLY
jgi:hypothetical protein